MDCEVKPILNQLVFSFLEDTSRGKFNEKSSGGILMVEAADKQLDNARWGEVLAIGPDVKDVEIGDIVLIQNLRWTNVYRVLDTSYWNTSDNEIIATWDDPNNLPKEVA